MSTSKQNHHPSQNTTANAHSEQQAVDLLRQKIDTLYTNEPDAKEELTESEAAGKHRSKHQRFMFELSNSDRSLADIQTDWHNYYVNLPDEEKHEVWQEFYAEHSQISQGSPDTSRETTQPNLDTKKVHGPQVAIVPKTDSRSVAEVKNQLISKIGHKAGLQSKKKAHFHSLLFGLSMGSIMVLILLFGFFNERFIAPFISPSKSVSNTPIVIDPTSAAVGPEAKIIIPKINVELPVVYDQTSILEKDIENSLESGVVHYASTPNPGEKGNGVIFGHSSNNILNKGKYKFAFVLLKQLDVGDTFYLQKNGKRYIYKVAEKKVVKPTDVSVLYADTAQPSMTLVTCDPPGTSLNRLLVVGQQISPDPGNNIASSAKKDTAQPSIIPSNAPSLWQRLTGWITS